jgi:putative FmdB family regulatory protein
MPTYEYVCTKCHHRFEAFQSIASKPLTVCPVCHGDLERLISGGAGLIFKGSGFYETDYKNKSNSESRSTKTTKVVETAEEASSKAEAKKSDSDAS